jgi:drug/metabolite transporter (DMT)-like permease
MNSPLPTTPSRLRGIALVCAGMFCFAAMDTVNKLLARGLPALEIAWGRYFGLFVLMTVILAPRFGLRLLRTRKPGLQIMRGVVHTVSATMAVVGLGLLPLADAAAIVNLQPLVIIALSAPMLGESVNGKRWIAVVLGFVGVLMVVRPGGDANLAGAAAMLAGCILGAVYLIQTRQLGLSENPMASLYLPTFIGSAGLSVLMPIVWVTPAHWLQWAGFSVTGFLGGVGHYFMIRAYTAAPPSTLAPFNYTYLAWGIVASWLVFADPPSWLTLAGIAVISGAGLYVIWLERREATAR